MQATVSVTTSAMLPQICSLGRGKKRISLFFGRLLGKFFFFPDSSFCFSIGDIINIFRTSTLELPSLTLRLGPGIADYFKVTWTYCMSPFLVPKPNDWKNHIGMNQNNYTGLVNK